MPKASKETASRVEDMGVMEGRYEELGGHTVGFESFREDADATPLFKGLPDDRCQSPHWGYVLRGRVTFRFADRDEVYETGDAYYAPPWHARRRSPDGRTSRRRARSPRRVPRPRAASGSPLPRHRPRARGRGSRA